MTRKKATHADLEKKRPLLFQLGFLIALSLAIAIFGYTRAELRPAGLTASLTEDISMEAEIPLREIKVDRKQPVKPKAVSKLLPPKDPQPEPDPGPEPDPFPDPELKVIEPIFQEPSEEEEAILPFLAVESMPHFRKCANTSAQEREQCTDLEIIRILSRTPYPRDLVSLGVEGTVWADFVITAKGEVTDAKIIRGLHPRLDSAVLQSIRALPPFEPGEQQGMRVPVIRRVPVRFRLQ